MHSFIHTGRTGEPERGWRRAAERADQPLLWRGVISAGEVSVWPGTRRLVSPLVQVLSVGGMPHGYVETVAAGVFAGAWYQC